MAKYNIYAVAYGLDPQTKEPVSGLKFHSWNECKLYVVGVENAKFKGFLTEGEADVWLAKTAEVQTEKEPIKKTGSGSYEMDADNIKKVTKALEENYNSSCTSLLPDFAKTCEELGVNPVSVALALQMQFVSQQKLLKTMKITAEPDLPFV